MLCILLAAAQTFGVFTDVELPHLGGSSADHATVAINGFGDIVVADHAEFAGVRQLTEVTIVQNVANRTWQLQPPILLGDPSLVIFGSDTCAKPDVTALGDDSFLVIWPRFSVADTTMCRLETARIVLRDSNGDLLPAPIIDQAAPGEGWVADYNLNGGIAGVMPDACALMGTDSRAYIVYAHEESATPGVAGFLRDYAIRGVLVDWSFPPLLPGWRDGPWLLASGVAIDNRYSEPALGGQVLPDVVVDDEGNVILAWEEYLLAEHPGWTGGVDTGRIHVNRYEAPVTGLPTVLMDEIVRTGSLLDRPQRRPMLATSTLDAENTILLAWNEDLATGSPDQIFFDRYVFQTGGIPGYLGPFQGYWNHSLIHQEALPKPVQTSDSSLCFATRDYGSDRIVHAGYEQSGSGWSGMVNVPATVLFPWRAAVDVLEIPRPSGGPMRQFFAITYEGADTRDPDQYAIHLLVAER
jgi:hypothetical protein